MLGWRVAFSCYRKSRLLSSPDQEFPAAAEALEIQPARWPGARAVSRGPLCPRAKAEDLARPRLGPTLTRAPAHCLLPTREARPR